MKTSHTTQNQDRLLPVYRVQRYAYAYIARAAEIHALEAPPAAREGCGDCGVFEKIRGLLG